MTQANCTIGVTASHIVGRAVQRNRVRRQIESLF